MVYGTKVVESLSPFWSQSTSLRMIVLFGGEGGGGETWNGGVRVGLQMVHWY